MQIRNDTVRPQEPAASTPAQTVAPATATKIQDAFESGKATGASGAVPSEAQSLSVDERMKLDSVRRQLDDLIHSVNEGGSSDNQSAQISSLQDQLREATQSQAQQTQPVQSDLDNDLSNATASSLQVQQQKLDNGSTALLTQNSDGTASLKIYDNTGKLTAPKDGSSTIQPNTTGTVQLDKSTYVNFDSHGFTVDAANKNPSRTPLVIGDDGKYGPPKLVGQNTDLDKSTIPQGSALADIAAKYPDAQLKNVGDGRVAVFAKDANGSSFGVFDANGGKVAPAGDGLQSIKPGTNNGLGSMALGNGSFINFDTKGISVDPFLKVAGEPLGFDDKGTIGVGLGTATQVSAAENPFSDPANMNGNKNGKDITNLFPTNGTPSSDDVNQTGVGDCYADAFMASLASTPEGQQKIKDSIQQVGTNPPAYAVSMVAPDGSPVKIPVDASMDSAGVKGKNGEGNWASIIEKAFAKYNDQYHIMASKNADGGSSAGMNGIGYAGSPSQVSKALLGTGSDVPVGDRSGAELGQDLGDRLGQGETLTAWTTTDGVSGDTKIPGGHAYSVLSVDQAAGTITVRNPWGRNPDTAGNDKSDGGVVTMSLDDFKKNFPYTSTSANT